MASFSPSPPIDLSAEKCLLGSLFHPLGADVVQDVLALMDPDDFADDAHKLLAAACLQVYQGGVSCDMVAVRDALGPNRLAKVGGQAVFADLIDALRESAPSGANALHYARIVRDKAIRRRAMTLGQDLLRQAADQSTHIRPSIESAARRTRILSGQVEELAADHAAIAPPGDDLVETMQATLARQEQGLSQTIALPWCRLSAETNALMPGTVTVLAGPSCVGKSYFTSWIAMSVHDADVAWSYLPLEDNAEKLAWRILGILAMDWRCTENATEGVLARQEALEEHQQTIEAISARVMENPRKSWVDGAGQRRVPDLPYKRVLRWIEQVCDRSRVVFIDPLSQIDFEGKSNKAQWQAEQDFIRQVLGVAAGTETSIVLVSHTVKRPGKAASVALSLEDIQGSARWNQLCHTALLLESHGRKTSNVYRPRGVTEETEHDRTVLIGKARNGRGTGVRLAYRMHTEAPAFDELGIITPTAKGD